MNGNHAHAPRFPQLYSRAKNEWSSLLELTPAGLDLLPSTQVARQTFELLSNAASSRRFMSVLISMQSHLRSASVPILITEQGQTPKLTPHEDLSRSQRRWLGQLALELYFTQLFRAEVAIVDLWPSRLGVDGSGDAVWKPRPFYLRWDPRFRDGLRDVYAGFFLDDRDRFDLGVFELGIGTGAPALLRHLGDGNQRSVRFGSDELGSMLGDMRKHRKDNDPPLHGNFMALGLSLVALHDLLGSLDMAFDVRAAFMRSYPADSHK